MKFFIQDVSPESIAIAARAESEDGGLLGDLFRDVGPGETCFGYTFEELQEMGQGAHDMKDGQNG